LLRWLIWFEPNNKLKLIAIISHDAGGAEILSSYARQHCLQCLFVLEGPALNIFERKLGPVNVCTLDEAISQAKSIICGTSWQSDLEFNALKIARLMGKYSIAFLDHWVNYRDRFIRSNQVIWPDEIWVGDTMAQSMAQEIFTKIPITLVDNPYTLDIQKELTKIRVDRLSSKDSISVLYVCEPISEHAMRRYGVSNFWGYVEEDAVRYFLSNISVLGKPIERILIRPHPSEKQEKYKWIQSEFELPIMMGGNNTLLEEVIESDFVVGCESMAMVIGLIAGKSVLSCIPPGGRACGLPHAEIISLQEILKTDLTP
jgi:hypothetical protein